jgi:RNA polymerase sigma factor (sigma-70 family)
MPHRAARSPYSDCPHAGTLLLEVSVNVRPEEVSRMDGKELVVEAKAGNVDAFTERVERYQAMVFGYAYSTMCDFHLAEEIAQESFIAAWRNLARLESPDRFGGWLRSIVRFQCTHLLRKRRLTQVPVAIVANVPGELPGPDELAEQRLTHDLVLSAIAKLPQPERDVTVLFYMRDCTQRQVGEFLGLPVSTVNNRLRAARALLKKGDLYAMTRDTLSQHDLPEDFAERIGEVLRSEGAVTDIRFPAGKRPPVLNSLALAGEPGTDRLLVEVIQHLDDDLVRCLSSVTVGRSGDSFTTGKQVRDTVKPVRVPLSHEAIIELITSLRQGRGATRLIETGVKVIDLFCPLGASSLVGLVGDMHSGKMVLVEELIQRLAHTAERITILVFVETPVEVKVVQSVDYRTSRSVEAIYLPVADASLAALKDVIARLDAVISLSSERAGKRLYPAIDPLHTSSRLLDPTVVGAHHCDVVQQVRKMLQEASSGSSVTTQKRAKLIERYFTQPFHVAEAFTGRPGLTVSRQVTIGDCQALLEGQHDSLDIDAVYMTGSCNP